MENKPKKALRGLFTRTESSNVNSAPSADLNETSKSVTLKQEKIIPVESVPESTPNLAVACDVTSSLKSQSTLPQIEPVLNSQIVTDSRDAWTEGNYLQLIKKIDRAQTEAFLLKGKLLDEVKARFFDDNKTGWKQFCDEKLEMNYTTANQYIRVATEFEQLASSRPEFGFEHFKALLPLKPEQRLTIIAQQDATSVKKLRQLAQEYAMSESDKNSTVVKQVELQEAKILVKNLEQLKEQIHKLGSLKDIPQVQKWQVAAACTNLSEELLRVSTQLNHSQSVRSHEDFADRMGASTLEAT